MIECAFMYLFLIKLGRQVKYEFQPQAKTLQTTNRTNPKPETLSFIRHDYSFHWQVACL